MHLYTQSVIGLGSVDTEPTHAFILCNVQTVSGQAVTVVTSYSILAFLVHFSSTQVG